MVASQCQHYREITLPVLRQKTDAQGLQRDILFYLRKLVLNAEFSQRIQHMTDIITVEEVSKASSALARAASKRARLETL
jgi:hypothetical protein